MAGENCTPIRTDGMLTIRVPATADHVAGDLDVYQDVGGFWLRDVKMGVLGEFVIRCPLIVMNKPSRRFKAGDHVTVDLSDDVRINRSHKNLGIVHEDAPKNAATMRVIVGYYSGIPAQEVPRFYAEFNENTTPAMAIANLSRPNAPPSDAATADPRLDIRNRDTLTFDILTGNTPAGIQLGRPIFADYHGYFIFASNGSRDLILDFGYRLFAGTPNEVTFWRAWQGGISASTTAIPLGWFDTIGTLPAGDYPKDSRDPSSTKVTLSQALFDAEVPTRLTCEMTGWERGTANRFSTRSPTRIINLRLEQPGVVYYQH